MKKLFLFLFILILEGNVFAKGDLPRVVDASTLGIRGSGSIFTYYNRLLSGCIAGVRLKDDGVADLFYGGQCQFGIGRNDSVSEITKSFELIIKYYDLDEVIKSKDVLTINIVWKIEHWPLIKYINEDDTWSKNIFDSLALEYPDRNVRYEKYKEILLSKIMHEEVYLPVLNVISDLGCNVKPSKYYADPIYMENEYLSREELIELGVFERHQVKKDVYPGFKGPIIFGMSCQSKGRNKRTGTHSKPH